MPKLFSWKRGKKKGKKTIRDALTPSPAFVAVPSTPPPGSSNLNPSNQSNPFTLPTSLPTQPTTPVHRVLETSQRGSHQQTSASQEPPTRTQVDAAEEGVGTYSLAGPSEDFSDDCEEPGYARVRTSSFNRPRFSSPQHTSTYPPPPHPTSSTPITKTQTSQSSKPNHVIHPVMKSPLEVVRSASDLPSVSSALSIHSDSSDNSYGLSPAPPTNQQSPGPLRSAKTERDPHIESPTKRQSDLRASELTEEKEALYTKVIKPKKKSRGKKKREYDQETNRTSNGRHAPHVSHSPQPTTAHRLQDESSELPSHSRQVRKQLFSDRPKHKSHSTENTGRSSRSSSHSQKMKEAASHHTPRDVEYVDQDYLPSGEESSTSLDNYLQQDGETSPDAQYPIKSQQMRKDWMSHSMELPSHRPPASPHSRSSREGHPRRRQSTGTVINHTDIRPASSSPLVQSPGLYVDPPVLQPSFVQRQGNVYVFSEQLPDGRVQYYSATPVQMPATHSYPQSHTPPSINRPHSETPTPHTPQAVSRPHSKTPTPHTPQAVSRPHSQTPTPHTPPLINHPQQGTNLVDGPHPVLKTTRNLTESGYFSNNTLAGHTQSTPYQQQSGSVLISTVQPEGGSTSSTLITPIELHSTPRQPQEESVETETGPSPQAKLLESSLQRVSGVETNFSPMVATATRTSPLLTERRSPITADDERDPPHKHMYQDLIAQYESREAEFKARNKELEALNRELKRENASVKKSYDDLMTQLNSSTEQLQSRLSSVMAENSSLKENRMDSEAKIRLLQSDLTKLKREEHALSDENKALLARQQATLEERGEWERVAAHAHSVMDENASLIKSQEVHRETIKQLKKEYQTVVSRLNKEIAKLHKEHQAAEGTLDSLRQSHTELLVRFDELSQWSARQVPLEEHQSVLQRLVEELDEKNDKELKSRETQMKISDKDKRYLVTKLTDAKAIICQLEREVAQQHKTHRKTHEKMMDLQRELELARDREVTLHSQLSKAVLCAEKAASERDTFAKIAKAQEQAKERAVVQGAKKEVSMERKLESHRYRQMEKASAILHEQDKDHRQQRDQYRREISNLKSLLEKKQTYVDKLIREHQSQ